MTTLTMTNPAPHGFVHDLDEQSYHTHQGSLSVSGAKVLLKAPALFKWQLDHPVHKDVFDFGTAAHKMVLGVGQDISVVMADDWRGKDARTARDEARAQGMIPILQKDYEVVLAMAAELKNHRLTMQLLSNGQPEVSAFAIDEDTGVLRRGRFDYLRDDLIIDFKTAASSDPDEFGTAAARYGYDMQASWYLDLARDLGRLVRGFLFVVQMKEAPFLVSVCELDADALARGRARNQRALERYRDCTATDLWPGYQADGEIASISLPNWALREEYL
jgi:hypothetical protein